MLGLIIAIWLTLFLGLMLVIHLCLTSSPNSMVMYLTCPMTTVLHSTPLCPPVPISIICPKKPGRSSTMTLQNGLVMLVAMLGLLL